MLRVDEFAKSIDNKVKDKNLTFIEVMRADNLLAQVQKKPKTLKVEELDEHE
jgi:hypothetical protein